MSIKGDPLASIGLLNDPSRLIQTTTGEFMEITKDMKLKDLAENAMGMHSLQGMEGLFKIRDIPCLVQGGYYEWHFLPQKGYQCQEAHDLDKTLFTWGDDLNDEYMSDTLEQNLDMTVGEFVDAINEDMERILTVHEEEMNEESIDYEMRQRELANIEAYKRAEAA
jgi:hypothetical protein